MVSHCKSIHSITTKKGSWRRMHSAWSLCFYSALLRLLFVSNAALPCAMSLYVSVYSLGSLKSSDLTFVHFPISSRPCVHAVSFMYSFFLFAFISWNWNFVHKSVLNMKKKDQGRKLCSPCWLEIVCIPEALHGQGSRLILIKLALSYGIDLAEWGFPQTPLSSNWRQLESCLVSDQQLKPGHCALCLRP